MDDLFERYAWWWVAAIRQDEEKKPEWSPAAEQCFSWWVHGVNATNSKAASPFVDMIREYEVKTGDGAF